LADRVVVPGFTLAPAILIEHLQTLLASVSPADRCPGGRLGPRLRGSGVRIRRFPDGGFFRAPVRWLLASATQQSAYNITLTSMHGGTLGIADATAP